MNQTNGLILRLLTPRELVDAGLLGLLDHVKRVLGAAILPFDLVDQGRGFCVTSAGFR